MTGSPGPHAEPGPQAGPSPHAEPGPQAGPSPQAGPGPHAEPGPQAGPSPTGAGDRPPPSHLWADLVDAATAGRLRDGGFARRCGFGERLAVLVIDVQNYMLGPVGDESIEYPSSCGEVGRRAATATAGLLRAARAGGVPVFYTRFELARDGHDMGAYRHKRALLDVDGWVIEGTFGAQVAEAVAPQPGDVVLVKKKPSAFVGTPLLGMLVDRGVDTVVVTGGSTSNCVRATAVDAASLNYRVVVPADCVFDRVDVSHRVSLFDLDRQYADVVWADDVVAHLAP